MARTTTSPGPPCLTYSLKEPSGRTLTGVPSTVTVAPAVGPAADVHDAGGDLVERLDARAWAAARPGVGVGAGCGVSGATTAKNETREKAPSRPSLLTAATRQK